MMSEKTVEKYALISVTDKSGLVEFARDLRKLGFKILSTGGTAKTLREAEITVIDASEFTDSPEIMGGRVKTLHPKIHGGILFDRNNDSHLADAQRAGIVPIDLVVVNLYQFEKQAVANDLTLEKAIEFIDVGGPTMLRAAAKNWQHVAPVISPRDYALVISELSAGGLTRETRMRLAARTFSAISRYDGLITNYFEKALAADSTNLPHELTLQLLQVQPLRYGENPHQVAGLYSINGIDEAFSNVEILQGKELSYNNLIDLDAATRIVKDFQGATAAVIVKHTNPCGAAISPNSDLNEVFKRALAGDPKSAFGGIVAVNREVDAATAKSMSEVFLECIAAPKFSADAQEIFAQKKNLRLVVTPWIIQNSTSTKLSVRTIQGALLVQTEDESQIPRSKWHEVSKNKPTHAQLDDLEFAMTIASHVKSNAIVYAKDLQTVAVGAGQMSRIDSAAFAAQKAKENGKDLHGAVMGSDAFFPFRDCVDIAAELGIAAIVQPGGSVRDEESIAAADQHGIVMLFTGERHFRH
jgi:phosphoribosylaminoimidazolecarboxamide formyltransferase/IMP cyclohydrolase